MCSLAIARLSILEVARRKEFYVILALTGCLAVWMLFLDLGTSGAGRFAKDIVMQAIWLASFALAAPLAARQITSDVEQKTVYVLMSRAIHRWQYVFGKAMGAVSASVICFTGLFLVLMFMLAAKGGGNIADPSLWQAFALQVVALAMLCSIVVFFSTFMSPAGAVTFSLVIFAVMRYGGAAILERIEDASRGVLQSVIWIIYLAMPHFEFFNMNQRVVHDWGPLPAGILAQAIVYGAVYSLVMVALAVLVFRKRWL